MVDDDWLNRLVLDQHNVATHEVLHQRHFPLYSCIAQSANLLTCATFFPLLVIKLFKKHRNYVDVDEIYESVSDTLVFLEVNWEIKKVIKVVNLELLSHSGSYFC